MNCERNATIKTKLLFTATAVIEAGTGAKPKSGFFDVSQFLEALQSGAKGGGNCPRFD
jgi:hypothetical protein